MTTTVSQAVAKVDDGPSATIAMYKDDFRMVLPENIRPETFVRLAQGVLRRNDKLMEAATNNPGSLMVALLDAARYGHEPGTEDYYLRPLKRKGVLEVQGIEGYRGIIKRMLNSGIVRSVIAEVVCTGDTFEFVRGVNERPVHHIDWFGDRGDLLGSYAYAVMAGGSTSQVVVCGPKEIALAKSKSEGATSEYSPWKTNPASMYRKTALRRLEPFVPKSSTYQGEVLDRTVEAQALIEAQALPPIPAHDPDTGEITEAEIVDDRHPFDFNEDTGDCLLCGQPEDADPHL